MTGLPSSQEVGKKLHPLQSPSPEGEELEGLYPAEDKGRLKRHSLELSGGLDMALPL